MPVPKLPKTQARLSTSVTIRLIPEDKLGDEALTDPTALANMVLQTAPIGAVERIEETNERTAYPRFEMDASKPGVVKEVYPGLVTMRTLTLNRVVLYSADALEAFTIQGDVVQQNSPFALIKTEVTPEGSGQPDRITIFRKCWFTGNPKAYALQADLKIVQSVKIAYAEREVVNVPKA